MKDTTIVLANQVNLDGTLKGQTIDRVENGVNRLNKKLTRSLTMSGGYTGHLEKPIYSFATAMELYAISLGVNEIYLHKEPTSLDTVGQAIFTKLGLILPKSWRDLEVLSNDYHVGGVGRVREIFGFVYGKEFNLEFVGIPTAPNDPELRTENQEKRSLDAFHNTFKDVMCGDDDAILNRLFEVHPFYKGKGPRDFVRDRK